jgi:tRNA(Leu) C34 or U34 (ribose-2'-O)-methylase TrmL
VCAFVRACLCVSSGLIFVSEFCFHLNHKFSSRALTY